MNVDILAGVFALAFLCEAIVEYLFADLVTWLCNLVQGKVGIPTSPTKVMKFVAAAVGIALCFGYSIDLMAILGLGLVPMHPAIGIVLSGIVIGRGSNYLNDFLGLTNRKPRPPTQIYPR